MKTVAQLIEELKLFDPNMPVAHTDDEGDFELGVNPLLYRVGDLYYPVEELECTTAGHENICVLA